MFFGLDVEKLLIIGVFAAMIIGPQKLPGLAQGLARFVVRARGWANDAKSRIKEEMGDDFDDVEWRKLDPRQYDPRRIVRQALLEDAPARPAAIGAPSPRTAPVVVPPVPTDPITALRGADDIVPASAPDAATAPEASAVTQATAASPLVPPASGATPDATTRPVLP